MSKRRNVHALILGIVLTSLLPARAAEVGTAVTYQGQLKSGGQSVTDLCTFEFTAWDATTNGTLLAGPVTAMGVSVVDGLFSAPVDLGAGVFTGGQAVYLEVAVRCGGDVGFTPLAPRQELTPAPHALALPGFYTQENATAANVIGGFAGNTVEALAVGASISGGGGSGDENQVFDDFGAIGGGNLNKTGSDDGLPNTAPYATVAGGRGNSATGNASAVAGGNSNLASGDWSAIAGGKDNQATGEIAFVAGGNNNVADGLKSTVVGGTFNNASGPRATVFGGSSNVASGESSAVTGGQFNTAAGSYSLAAGRRAKALHDGTIVLADSTDADFASTLPDQFLIRAAGGVGINTNDPLAALHVGGVDGVDGIMFPDGTLQTTAATGGGGGNTLDEAYNQGGAGAGRTITADAGAVEIAGDGGLQVAGTIQSGNSILIDGTSAGLERIVSTDALEIHTSTGRGWRVEPAQNGNTISPNIIGGADVNSVGVGVVGATIAGGGKRHPTISAFDRPNRATANGATVGGGSGNTASARASTVSGGEDNVASELLATVGGGALNNATAASSTVGGGIDNTASGVDSTVGGGFGNVASNAFTTVAGGYGNEASGEYATVGGGRNNVASGTWSMVPGGQLNTAGGDYSFAAGRRAKAIHDGSFVWTDSTNADFASTAANQFLIRASGNVGIGTNSPARTLDVLAGSGTSMRVGTNDVTNLEIDYFNTGLADIPGTASGMNLIGPTNAQLVVDVQANDANDGFYVRVPSTLETPNAPPDKTVLAVKGDGNVGIGTASPVSDLDVTSGASNFTGLNLKNTTSDQRFLLQVNGTSPGGTNREGNFEIWGTSPGQNHNVFTGTPEGNVGIGTNGPDEQLHVAGNIKATGTIVSGDEVIIDNNFAELGVGTTNPQAALHVVREGSVAKLELDTYSDSFGGSVISSISSRGTRSAPSPVLSGDRLLLIDATGYDGDPVRPTVAKIVIEASEDWTGSANGTSMSFFTQHNGSSGTLSTPRMKIESTGIALSRTSAAHPLHVGTNIANGNGAHLTAGGTWTNGSDRNSKQNFEPVSNRAILEKVVDMPITQWQYKGEDDQIRHIGPTAQDFYTAFGLGHDEKYITTIDADGVALAAIQGLHAIVEDKDAEIANHREQIADLTQRLKRLEALVAALAKE